ncbi:hypothetical protein FNV43_RR11035 [Rhamnella rubrinervis]|uniref:Uncharacterized protein n=1 Tax=Rhamnella rubrinervis TaxID=2594499 RepID=A0A8K0H5J9_9ROSA|nr:hypothetical protein FNV43_RR11035 [Rhamnella rubrinervis]
MLTLKDGWKMRMMWNKTMVMLMMMMSMIIKEYALNVMAPVDPKNSKKQAGGQIGATTKDKDGMKGSSPVHEGSQVGQNQSKYGLRVIQGPSASEVKKSVWINVRKVPAGNRGRGRGIMMPTRTSPRKFRKLPASVRDNPTTNDVAVDNERSGTGSFIQTRGSYAKIQEDKRVVIEKLKQNEGPLRRSPRKKLNLARETLQGEDPSKSTPSDDLDEDAVAYEDEEGCEEGRETSFTDRKEPPIDGNSDGRDNAT